MASQSKKIIRRITAADLVGRITPGSTVYKDENTPLTVDRISWFGDYCLDVIFTKDGRSYPATQLMVAAAG